MSVAHTEFALRWLPAGSLSADAHLHRDLAEGMGEHRQTCTHKQTDEYARAKHGEMFRETHKDEHRCLQPGIRGFVLILVVCDDTAECGIECQNPLYQSNQLSAFDQVSLNCPPNLASFAFPLKCL